MQLSSFRMQTDSFNCLVFRWLSQSKMLVPLAHDLLWLICLFLLQNSSDLLVWMSCWWQIDCVTRTRLLNRNQPDRCLQTWASPLFGQYQTTLIDNRGTCVCEQCVKWSAVITVMSKIRLDNNRHWKHTGTAERPSRWQKKVTLVIWQFCLPATLQSESYEALRQAAWCHIFK